MDAFSPACAGAGPIGRRDAASGHGVLQLTIDANDPALLARFWAKAGLPADAAGRAGHDLAPALRARLGEEAAFDDRLFDPAGLRPPIWFQQLPETKAGKNRLHVDLYPTGQDNALPLEGRVEIVEAKGAELARLGGNVRRPRLGGNVRRRTRHDDPDDPVCYVVMHDPGATSSASAEHCSGWRGGRRG